MNILVVSHYGLYDDLAASFVHDQVCAYTDLGHQVKVIIPIAIGKKGGGEAYIAPTLSHISAGGASLYYVHFCSLSNFGKRGFNNKSAILSIGCYLSQILEGFHPDIIHAHTLGFDSAIGAWLKKKLHCPLVVTSHGSDTSIPFEKGNYAALRSAAAEADSIVTVSHSLQKKLELAGIRTPLSTILNGFRIDYLKTNVPRQASIIQVGTLTKNKRTDITLSAFASLYPRHPDMTMCVIGWGVEEPNLKAFAQTHQIPVRFLGRVSNQEVLTEMSKSCFFVMPSVREGFGIVYLEAMASGCITIGTEGEGIADLIVSGENGFLVPPDAPEAIVRVVEWCLAHPKEASAIAERGRRAALELTWEKNAAQYLNLFASLIGEKERNA